LKGTFKGFNLKSYLSALGSNVTFAAVPAYTYVTTPTVVPNDKFKVTITGSKEDDNVTAKNSFAPKREDIKENNPPEWFSDTPTSTYDFTGLLNSGSSISYEVEMPEAIIEITKDVDIGKITANLAVLLPMVFKFEANSSEEKQINNSEGAPGYYLPISFAGLDKFLEGGGGSGGKSVMEQIEEQLGEGSGIGNIELRLKDIKNNVTSSIYLAIPDPKKSVPGPGDWTLIEIVSDKPDPDPLSFKNISLDELPQIKFLLKEPGKEAGGTLYIKSVDSAGTQPDFSVKISVVADINLDKTIP
jgi:hypothetical protein